MTFFVPAMIGMISAFVLGILLGGWLEERYGD